MKSNQRIYWDSCIFLSWFNNEANADKCLGTIELAKQGKIRIVTSALTLTEVVKLKGHPPLPKECEQIIRKFFESDFISIVAVDRYLAEQARELVWTYGLHPKDSIHLATAVRLNIPVLHTFDKKLINLNYKIGSLAIREPDISADPQMKLIPTEVSMN